MFMDLIIIGNGFDKAHGIACSYRDFRNYLERTDDHVLLFLEEAFPRENKNHDLMLWSDFEEALAFPDVNLLEEWGDSIHILDENNKDVGWLIDGLKKAFCGWIEDLCFEGSISLPEGHPYKRFLNKDNVYLCFNYTDTLERFYDINDVNYIHGKVFHQGNKTGLPLVFGHRHIEADNNPFVLATEKPVEAIIEKKTEWFSRLSKEIKGQIVVMGLSCSEVDQKYLKKIHSVLPKIKWRFFYYSRDDKVKIISCANKIGLSKSDYVLESSSEQQ